MTMWGRGGSRARNCIGRRMTRSMGHCRGAGSDAIAGLHPSLSYSSCMPSDTTLIRVPLPVRDRVRKVASRRRETFGQVIDYGLDLIEREQFWTRIADLKPDDAYRDEFATWDAEGFDTDDEEDRRDGQPTTR